MKRPRGTSGRLGRDRVIGEICCAFERTGLYSLAGRRPEQLETSGHQYTGVERSPAGARSSCLQFVRGAVRRFGKTGQANPNSWMGSRREPAGEEKALSRACSHGLRRRR
ncbi:hypothetical protein [Desulfatiglans anilini]|uniref:hypothetical protein n=1 Tax=Desulfatiglans anilini TaxID=90728 RepID=UPI000403714F|nr:hypothetical protein [Desulfatiglans anilini]